MRRQELLGGRPLSEFQRPTRVNTQSFWQSSGPAGNSLLEVARHSNASGVALQEHQNFKNVKKVGPLVRLKRLW